MHTMHPLVPVRVRMLGFSTTAAVASTRRWTTCTMHGSVHALATRCTPVHPNTHSHSTLSTMPHRNSTPQVAKPAKDALSEVVRSADLISYTAEEGVRYLGEGQLLNSDSFPGNARNKLCLVSKVGAAGEEVGKFEYKQGEKERSAERGVCRCSAWGPRCRAAGAQEAGREGVVPGRS